MFARYNSFLDIAESEIFSARAAVETRKIKLKEKWQETKKMPRKMKKRVRKEIIFEWNLIHYDPLGINNIDLSMLHDVIGLFKSHLYNKK